MSERRPIIAVIGGGDGADARAKSMAEEVGFLLARADAITLCGGLNGVMAAACSGAKRGGGLTVGVLPGATKSEANEFVDIPIVTAMSTARNAIIVRTADAIIAIDGAYGTLTEMAYAFDLGKKVFALESWELAKVGVDPKLFIAVRTPRDAVERAIEEARHARA